ncbi:MAG: hypothetical protein ISS56_16800 [Anaerolineae bacterium]|nr:hypothetical protein [Anaerolineae bacterium]
MIRRPLRVTARLAPFFITLALILAACLPASEATELPDTPPPPPPSGQTRTAAQGTYYVRPLGGSPAQCTGLVDADYPGSGTVQPCAWDHPFRAFPPDGTAQIAGGSALIIAYGQYQMGYGAPGADACEADGAYACHMPPIPGGPAPGSPTRILGAGWDTGCAVPPQLWGTERATMVLNLDGSDNIEVACLEITDRSGCVEDHYHGLGGSQYTCVRDTPPFGPWAAVGLYAADSSNVYLHHLDIHGLAVDGVHAGRLSDWTVEDVRIAANGWSGWNGDIDDADSNSGTMTFRRFTVEWNGCAETYPGQQPVGCWGQQSGGYGDGIGTGETGGHWLIEDSAFLHNTSDGLDLLYVHGEGATITVRRTVARGNAGDQIKTSGSTHIENALAVSDCSFFEGKPFSNFAEGDSCRSGGSAVAFNLHTGDQATLINSTLTGEGDCLLIAVCEQGQCDGSESVTLRNNILYGHTDWYQPEENTCYYWYDDRVLPSDLLDISYAIIQDVKSPPEPCPPNSQCGISPGLANESLDAFDGHLQEGSPAIDAGTAAGAPATDIERRPRTAPPDIGAYEYGEWEPSAWLYLPAITRRAAFLAAAGLGIGQ